MRNRLEEFENKQQRRHIIGVGLDSDGHKRLTRAERFSVVGGSEETHGKMTETLIRTFEDLSRKGKTLEQTGYKELAEIIAHNSCKI